MDCMRILMDDIASSTDINLTKTQFYNRIDEINILESVA